MSATSPIDTNLAALVTNVNYFASLDPNAPPNISVEQGQEAKKTKTSPNRILFLLDSKETFTGQKQMGGGGAFGVMNPKGLLTRVVSFEVWIWGLDPTNAGAGHIATEQMIGYVVNAIHYALGPGAYQLSGGEWLSEQGSLSNLGKYYVLKAAMLIPIMRPAQATVSVPPATVTIQLPIPDPMETTN